MRNTQTTNTDQQDLETTTKKSISSYFWNIAKHAIPIIGTIWVTNNINCAYPTSVKDNVVMPTLEETVLVQEAGMTRVKGLQKQPPMFTFIVMVWI